ncbi:hypothetical protein GBAR_LOCUS15378 [Geodia barretti]|uniref:Uncharacterized protein n=1 Tax=Geodia barretti TaxID=519541 RepID=A0AA35SDW0_GEOBA|nr:hypothetical protein GBAR_LOCUS15378 [Geodia barretti]
MDSIGWNLTTSYTIREKPLSTMRTIFNSATSLQISVTPNTGAITMPHCSKVYITMVR